MEKRSPRSPALLPRSPLVYEKYKSGCAWSLIGLFDFRHGHSNTKLVSDKRRVNRHSAGSECRRNKLDLHLESHNSQVKHMMEKEMSCKQQVKKKVTIAKVQDVQCNSELVDQLPKKQRTSRKVRKPRHMPIHGCKNAAAVEHIQASQQTNKCSMRTAIEGSCNRADLNNGRDSSSKSTIQAKHDQLPEINLQVHINEAAEAFINQKFIDGQSISRGAASNQSNHFIDALEILNSNKELFIKLLQDPNSLLVKHIQELRDSQSKDSQLKSSTEAKLSETRICEGSVCSQRIRSSDAYASNGSGDPRHANEIVVLKPHSTILQNDANRASHCSCQQSTGHSVRPAYFSLKDMKKKLRQAMGLDRKEGHWLSTEGTIHKLSNNIQSSKGGGKRTEREIFQRNSPDRSHFDDIKRRENISDAKDMESGVGHAAASTSGRGHKVLNSSIFRHPEGIESNLYLESWQCLSNHLSHNFGHRNEAFTRRKVTETAGRIASLPEYDFLAACGSGKDRQQGFLTAHMRYTPYSYYPEVNRNKGRLFEEKPNGCRNSPRESTEASMQGGDKQLDDQSQISDAKPNQSENFFPDTEVIKSIYCHRNDLSPKGSMKIVDTNYTNNSGEVNPLAVSSEQHCMHNSSTNQTTYAPIRCRKNGYLEYSNVDPSLHNCMLAFPDDFYLQSPLRMDDSTCKKDGIQQPSPVSVLEQIDVEDIVSPESIISRTAEQPIQPHEFEEQLSTSVVRLPLGIKVGTGPASEYVKSVLQTSDLNWDKLLIKCHSSEQLLDQSLFDHMEAQADESCSDHRLLFDYINEVLLEVNQCYSSPWVVFVERKLLPVTVTNDVIQEALKSLDWQLLSELLPETLEQLIEKDLAKSGTWMDNCIDAEEVLVDVVDDVLEELMTETLIKLHS